MVQAVANRYEIHRSIFERKIVFSYQSVTGTPNADDVNSYWQIHGDQNTECERG